MTGAGNLQAIHMWACCSNPRTNPLRLQPLPFPVMPDTRHQEQDRIFSGQRGSHLPPGQVRVLRAVRQEHGAGLSVQSRLSS